MRSGTGPSGPTCSASAGAQQAAGAATPVDGVYRADVTMAELKRGPGFDDGEANPSNVGHFKFELRNGRFRMSGASDGTEVIGTYTVKGDDFAFSFNGEGPYRYRWSLYRGALTLRKRGSGPTGLVVQPWRRVGGGASIGAPTPLDGIWVMTSTRAEAAKHTSPWRPRLRELRPPALRDEPRAGLLHAGEPRVTSAGRAPATRSRATRSRSP